MILSRRGADPAQSNTAKLFAKGKKKIAQKLGEEAVETLIEGAAGDKDGVITESADLLYHSAGALGGGGREAGRSSGGAPRPRRHFRHRREGVAPERLAARNRVTKGIAQSIQIDWLKPAH